MKQTPSIPGARQLAMTADLTQRVRRALSGVLHGHADAAPRPALRVPPAAAPLTPRALAIAQSSDKATQQQLTATYESCLACYRQIARARGVEADDVVAAVAFFVAVNLHALHGIDIEAGALRPLERQLHGVTHLIANWDGATLAQRQSFFERFAIVSILVSGSHEASATHDHAARAQVQRSARDYLQHLLGLDPDRLTLGPDGLVLRDHPAAARAA
jgi:hypothetical protein